MTTELLEAYVDESEHEELGVFGLAGYLWTPANSKTFDAEWRKTLSSFGLTNMHMAEFENRRGDFADLAADVRIGVLQSLHDVIRETALLGACANLDVRGYSDLGGDPKLMYQFCALALMTHVAVWLEAHGMSQASAAYVFDHGRDAGQLKTRLSLAEAAASKGIRVKSVDSATTTDRCQLQAADLLAYETSKAAAKVLGRHDRPVRKSIVNLLNGSTDTHTGVLLDEAYLRKFQTTFTAC